MHPNPSATRLALSQRLPTRITQTPRPSILRTHTFALSQTNHHPLFYYPRLPLHTTAAPKRAAVLYAGRTPTTTTTTTTTPRRALQRRTMSTDDDYAAFLEKANQDPMAGRTTVAGVAAGGSSRELKTMDEGEEIPVVLAEVTKGKFYVSDADEPFMPVALRWDEGGQGLPDEEQFAKLVQHWDPSSADVEIQDPSDWNRSGEYGDVVDAVGKAVKGADVRVYRVVKDATRVEYFVIGCEGTGKGARLLGVKALAVES